MENDNFFGKDWASAQKAINENRMKTDPLWPETSQNPNYSFPLGKFASEAKGHDLTLPSGVTLDHTRFQDGGFMSLIYFLMEGFSRWCESLKGRLPVPSYDIADPRIDEEKETEFFNLVRQHVYNEIIRDAENFAEKGEKTSYDKNSVVYLSFSAALVLCAYYHHSFDPVIANENL